MRTRPECGCVSMGRCTGSSIVGAGFGGPLGGPGPRSARPVEVTVVDQRNFHTFQPLLYEVATAGLEAGDVAYPIRAIFGRSRNVTFRFGHGHRRRLGPPPVPWRGRARSPSTPLIVASGATARFFGIPGASEYSFPLYTLTDARRLRDHVLRRLEDADADPDAARRTAHLRGRRRRAHRRRGGRRPGRAARRGRAPRRVPVRPGRGTDRPGRRPRPPADPVPAVGRRLRRPHPRAAGASSCGSATWSGR